MNQCGIARILNGFPHWESVKKFSTFCGLYERKVIDVGQKCRMFLYSSLLLTTAIN